MAPGRKRSDRRPRWTVEVSNVMIAMTQSRLALRRAARRVEDRRLSQRLLRLARRKRASAAELRRAAPSTKPQADVDEEVALFPSEIATATEIGSVAACLRANRRLRAAVGRALDAGPPGRVLMRLEVLRDETDREAASLNARLNDLVVAPVLVDHPEQDPSSEAGVAPGADATVENITQIR